MSLWGIPRLPVPFFLAGLPQDIFSTSWTVGRHPFWRASQVGFGGAADVVVDASAPSFSDSIDNVDNADFLESFRGSKEGETLPNIVFLNSVALAVEIALRDAKVV